MRQEETIRREILEQRIDRELEALSEKLFGKKLEDASDEQVYVALLYLVKGLEEATVPNDGDKKIYYISAEFLIGKLLSNNLINLGIYEKVESVLKSKGKELSRIEEIEPEPSLGNGGLGRLAACFMDSIATLGLPGEGIGLNYHFGLFKQVFKDRLQTAEKNDWIEKDSWLNKTDVSFDVFFGDRKVTSRLYDIDVVGYNNGVNKLRLFDIESVDESIVKEGITFDKEAIEKNLTLFLYPDDSDEAGNLLRIYQQYFMVSNAAQLILMEMKEKQYDLRKMYDYAVIQINDTHPSMIIPELIRILVNDKAFTMDEAIEVVSKTCAYTNHTILAEALEKWPLSYLEKVVPQLVPIIKELSARVAAKYSDPKVQIIDDQNRVHMAHMDIHYGFSVNGVAAIHTEILKDTELHAFYEIYPGKFNNKTNGITFRRWLLSCNRELAALITEKIGTGYQKDAMELEKLLSYTEGRDAITSQDVNEICTVQTTGQIFEMIRALAEKNQKKALNLYYDLLSLKEPPMRILFLIARQFHQLLLVKSLAAKGYDRAAIASRAKIAPFVAGRCMAQAKSFTTEQLKTAVQDCVQAEEDVKTGKIADTLSVELLILKYSK